MSIELLPRSAGDEPKTTGVPSPQERVLVPPHIKTHGKRRVEHEIRTVFILVQVGVVLIYLSPDRNSKMQTPPTKRRGMRVTSHFD
jgi:hypothetical protein